MGQEQIIDLIWKYFPITEILLASIVTSILTHGVSYFFPENHKLLKPKFALLIASMIASFLVVQFEKGVGVRAYAFNICVVWGVSVAFYEYGGGKWLLDLGVNFLKSRTGKKNDNPPAV